MKGASTFRIVMTALFAALTCVATLLLRIPSVIGGYLNLGDGVALLGAYLLGPVHGALAAGLGSMLADLLAGYPMYAAGTLAIKGLAAFVAGWLGIKLAGRGAKPLPALLCSALAGEALMIAGYFAFSALALGYGMGAAAEIPGNLCQAAAGIAVAAALTPPLRENPGLRALQIRMRKP